MNSKKTFVILSALVILIFSLANVSHANLINGDFSNGLTGWTFGGLNTVLEDEGDVTVTQFKEARLGDNNMTVIENVVHDYYWQSYLYQSVKLAPSLYTFEFDFKSNLSLDVPDFGSPDTFFASLYFSEDEKQFDSLPSGGSIDLFNLDYIGKFLWDENNEYIDINGDIGPSSKGSDWFHFSTTFNNETAYIIPTFEFLDGNYIENDSQIYIDNVSITPVSGPAPVPEPATLILLGSGLAALTGLARRKRKFS